jgi:hypothetical protein
MELCKTSERLGQCFLKRRSMEGTSRRGQTVFLRPPRTSPYQKREIRFLVSRNDLVLEKRVDQNDLYLRSDPPATRWSVLALQWTARVPLQKIV